MGLISFTSIEDKQYNRIWIVLSKLGLTYFTSFSHFRFSISSPRLHKKGDHKLSSKCIVKCGNLVKSPPVAKHNFFSAWKKRYFVLYDAALEENKFCDQTCYLYYYKDRKDDIPIGKLLFYLNDSKSHTGTCFEQKLSHRLFVTFGITFIHSIQLY